MSAGPRNILRNLGANFRTELEFLSQSDNISENAVS